jgi:hypothetical protein
LSQADSLNLVDENFSEHHEAPAAQQLQQTGQEEKEASIQGAGGKAENEEKKQPVCINNYWNLYYLLNEKLK